MQPLVNDINLSRRVSRIAHGAHKEENGVFIRTTTHISEYDNRKYRRVHCTYHSIQKEFYFVDNDMGRHHADSYSQKFRGFSTTEF